MGWVTSVLFFTDILYSNNTSQLLLQNRPNSFHPVTFNLISILLVWIWISTNKEVSNKHTYKLLGIFGPRIWRKRTNLFLISLFKLLWRIQRKMKGILLKICLKFEEIYVNRYVPIIPENISKFKVFWHFLGK